VKLVRKVKIINAHGLHTRPATHIAKILQNCKSSVTFKLRKDVVNAKSILSLLMLAAAKNSTITVTIEGNDADEFMEKVVNAFQTGFGE
jgi:phosphocarrier protein